MRDFEAWHDQGMEFLWEFKESGDPQALAKSLPLLRRSVETGQKDKLGQAGRCVALSHALQLQARVTSSRTVLDEAIQAARTGLDATFRGHPVEWRAYAVLAGAHELAYDMFDDVTALRDAVHPLSMAVIARRQSKGRDQRAERARLLVNLGLVHGKIAARTRDVEAARQAVGVAQEARSLLGRGDPDLPAVEGNLGLHLRVHYELAGTEQDLWAGLAHSRAAVSALQPGSEQYLMAAGDLSVTLQVAAERNGDIRFAQEAVSLGRQAASFLTGRDGETAKYLAPLATALQLLHSFSGELALLDEAVTLGRRILELGPATGIERAEHQTNLANALRLRADFSGASALQREAVGLLSEAAEAYDLDDPRLADVLLNLSNELTGLYIMTGDFPTLYESDEVAGRALALVRSHDPDRARHLLQRSYALLALYRRTGDDSSLEEAIGHAREAVERTPLGHSDLPSRLSALSDALLAKVRADDDEEHLPEAVRVARGAVEHCRAGRPERARLMSDLADALLEAHSRTGNLAPLSEAVDLGRRASEDTPPGRPHHGAVRYRLGQALLALYKRTGDRGLAQEARAVFGSAAGSTAEPTGLRIAAYRGVAEAAHAIGDDQGTLATLEEAVALLPQVSPRRLANTDRSHRLAETAGLAGEAAAAAIRLGRPERALELLEQVRGLLLAEAVDAHDRLAALKRRDPELAARFVALRNQLDAAQTDTDDPVRIRHRQQTADEWQRTVEEIRAIPGLEGFLTPPSAAHLASCAADGHVVVINSSRFRCDALVVTADPRRPVQVIEFPGLTQEAIVDQVVRCVDATSGGDDTVPQLARRMAADAALSHVLGWLWDEITEPVLNRLGLIGAQNSGGGRPRLWWCPVGEVAYLPLHAAGHHEEGPQGKRTIPDRIVSSYTPTLRALIRPRTESPSTNGALVVAMPETPGSHELSAAQEEAVCVSGLVNGARTLVGPKATYTTVLDALPHYPVVHFSCHVRTDWADPNQSLLLLHDHQTRPLTVSAIAALRLDGGELAFLSACGSSLTAPRHADQAVHITAAFQLAGYRQVIGTLWPIVDDDGLAVAEAVYTVITDSGATAPRTGQAAEAVTDAVRSLRHEVGAGKPTRWAAYIHVGK
ncbi:CHAT domain-containing protein [Actinomadura formosensis]|uniref:CHAT domain-containing protein n=1 Tax=Actinomadura formosensis TaxID=60706 RepID=UPI003D912F15